jgi:NADH:ubiquinone oxidoreductase subunit 5 (subunit L)/multisubunit Na+/H+ antiporter MnhA subunit
MIITISIGLMIITIITISIGLMIITISIGLMIITISIGLMIITIITISIGLSGLAFFHLLTHALFNALLFICAGGVIHSVGDSQDIRFIRPRLICSSVSHNTVLYLI